jgi:hypothetical protein
VIIEPQRDILLWPLLRTGGLRAWAARDDFIRLSVVPLVALLVILLPLLHAADMIRQTAAITGRVPDDDPGLGAPLLLVAYGAIVAIFSVNWLRQLTLGRSAAPGLGLAVSVRHVRFFFATIAISVVAVLPMIVVAPVFVVAIGGLGGIISAAVMFFVVWAGLTARLSPSLIGIAIDAPMPVRIAWRRTKGQGFKLVFALLAVEIAAMLAVQILDTLFDATGLLTAAPMTYLLLTAVIGLVTIALQLAILVSAFPLFLRETV